MKTIIATVILFTSVLGARLSAADPSPVTLSVEQQFEQADIQLAIEQYKKLRMAAFDLSLKLQVERPSPEQSKELEVTLAQLQNTADQLRARTVSKATVADANPKRDPAK